MPTWLHSVEKNELTDTNGLNGFREYILALPGKAQEVFKSYPHWAVFGEWSNKNKIVYNDTGKQKHWYVFDIYDTVAQQWLLQSIVKKFCEGAGLEYIQELYYGEFVSWEHCRQFLHKNSYGDTQEGIVIKNQSKLDCLDSLESNLPVYLRPTYLKIVNDEFKERMETNRKHPNTAPTQQITQKLTDSIVTKNRVEKMIFKLRDEGVLPEKIRPEDMKTVATYLPKRIYEDCKKEEPETVKAVGEYFPKQCSSTTMKFAREILL